MCDRANTHTLENKYRLHFICFTLERVRYAREYVMYLRSSGIYAVRTGDMRTRCRMFISWRIHNDCPTSVLRNDKYVRACAQTSVRVCVLCGP